MKTITSVYYGKDTYKLIGILEKEFTKQTICVQPGQLDNEEGKFKMVNGGKDGVSYHQLVNRSRTELMHFRFVSHA